MTVLEPVLGWLVSCKLKKVTVIQIMDNIGMPKKPILRVMDKLVREGYAEEVEDNKIQLCRGEFGKPRRNPTWKLLEKPLSDRPTRRPKRQTNRDKLWTAIRRQRIFTRKDLIRSTGLSMGSVESYTKLLERDGYLKVKGNDGHQKVYTLTKGLRDFSRPLLKEKVDE
ncbi:hypothetical protein JYT85_01475 [Desulfocapsa sp. AH-315-G09]|uniref:HTH marR-type domain-containing protein n=1 Tax=Desulfotalea psychrophila TaxID=84980 RepID=A0ABS3AUW1_9BACT|nr:hypothetical protein [Desulfocapsa sp.]MBN4065297.1 hypothetical protein [Desulfocapsa sp. AH-315-G09]MBN4068427.1 hypothetical protein [Desulfotalea psychrophila]